MATDDKTFDRADAIKQLTTKYGAAFAKDIAGRSDAYIRGALGAATENRTDEKARPRAGARKRTDADDTRDQARAEFLARQGGACVSPVPLKRADADRKDDVLGFDPNPAVDEQFRRLKARASESRASPPTDFELAAEDRELMRQARQYVAERERFFAEQRAEQARIVEAQHGEAMTARDEWVANANNMCQPYRSEKDLLQEIAANTRKGGK